MNSPPPPTPPPSGGLGREEPTRYRTRLPHNFRCVAGHWHAVTCVEDVLSPKTPKCLLRRIVLEWAGLDPEPSEGGEGDGDD